MKRLSIFQRFMLIVYVCATAFSGAIIASTIFAKAPCSNSIAGALLLLLLNILYRRHHILSDIDRDFTDTDIP